MSLGGSKPTVVVTGFGPFLGHAINASWACVQELRNLYDKRDDVSIVVEELPVEYDAVSKLVPELWNKYQPHLMVHVGVSGIAEGITLEQQAHNDGYTRKDIKGCTPHTQCCVNDCSHDCLISQIDMVKVKCDIDESECEVESFVSTDPGRYLCDFCFFTSLNRDPSRTAFIHIPRLDEPYTCTQLTQALDIAINSMLKQLGHAQHICYSGTTRNF